MAFAVLALATVAVVAAEILVPGRAVYHAGWFNVAFAVLTVAALLAARRRLRDAGTNRGRVAIVAVALGAAIAGIAGVASGLLAPDTRLVIGAPGTSVPVGDLGGTLIFPFAGDAASGVAPAVVLARPGRGSVTLGARSRDVGSFVVREVPREVVSVEARDARGGRLTVTQPSGIAFLSPVLLMAQRRSISGLDLPYDAFAVPAAHRLVKAVLFTPQEAAMMRGAGGVPAVAVLFAVDDEDDRPLPHAIAFVRVGETAAAGGLRLRAAAFAYPAVELVAVPTWIAVVFGALLVLGGLFARGVGGSAPVSGRFT